MKRLLVSFLCLSVVVLAAFGQASPSPESGRRVQEQILAITGATLIDGSGSAPLHDAVVVIAGDRIKAAGSRQRVAVPLQARLIDARGLIVAPGFIDMHNHSERGLDADPASATQVSQGITTVALGDDSLVVTLPRVGYRHRLGLRKLARRRVCSICGLGSRGRMRETQKC